MTKITLNPVANLIDATTAAAAINANSSVIQTAFDNTLSRDGTAPNQMAANLDMNSNQILNLPQPATSNSPLRLQDLTNFNATGTISNIPVGGVLGQALTKRSSTDYDYYWAGSSTQSWLNVRDYGATGNGSTDDTAAISTAITAAAGRTLYFPKGTYKISGSGTAVFTINTQTNLIGEGENGTVIDISSVGTSTDVFRITPTSISAGMTIFGFNFVFTTATVSPAQDLFSITTSGATNYIAGLYIGHTTVSGTVLGVPSGVGRHALYVNNAGGNVGGGVFLSEFEHNNWVAQQETVYLSQAGDSLHFSENHIASILSRGYFVDLILGAGNFISENDNVTCLLGSHRIDSGAAAIIKNCLIEQTGLNTAGAILDFRGGLRKLDGGLIEGNQIQEPGSGLGNPISINIDNADSIIVGANPIIRRNAAGTHINVTALATNTVINLASRFFIASTEGVATIVDAGTGTSYQGTSTTRGTTTTVLHGDATGAPGVYGKVALADMANINASTLLGNFGGTQVPPEEVVPGATLAFSGNQLRTIAGTGDVTWAANTFTTTIGNNTVTNAKRAQMPSNGFKGNNTGGASNELDLTVAQSQTLGLQGLILGGKLIGANLNSTADQAITITSPTANYRILQILAVAKTGTFGTAVGGVYTATSKGGVQVVTSAQAYSGLTSTTIDTLGNALILSTTNTNTMVNSVGTIYFSLTTPQGGTSTADLYVYIIPLY